MIKYEWWLWYDVTVYIVCVYINVSVVNKMCDKHKWENVFLKMDVDPLKTVKIDVCKECQKVKIICRDINNIEISEVV